MAKNRTDGADLEMSTEAVPKKSTGKESGAPGGSRSARAAAKPNGPVAEGVPTKRSPTRGAAVKSDASAKAASGSKSTRGSGARGATEAAAPTARKSAGGKRGNSLQKDLREFASTRPQGWSHDDWLNFLDDLQARGHNINDRDEIGSMLERERLSLALEKIPGLGPQRVRAIANRYGYLWRLKETNADQLSREADVPRAVAEKVVESLRS